MYFKFLDIDLELGEGRKEELGKLIEEIKAEIGAS
jgi:hypothetical protein